MTKRSKTPRWALDAIEHARADESKVLFLSGFLARGDDALTSLPEEVFSCTKLERLHLDDNALAVVPHLGRLKHLRAIHLLGNPLRELADQPGLVLDWSNYLELQPRLTPSHVIEFAAAVRASLKHSLNCLISSGSTSHATSSPSCRRAWDDSPICSRSTSR